MESFDLLKGTDESEDVSGRCLVGKILAPKLLNRQVVLNIIHSAWKTRKPVRISSWNDNVYLFQFEELADRQKVLEDAPWSVMGSLLALQPLQPEMVTSELEFQGLLLQCNFLRIRVEVDVTKPLLQGFILHRKEEWEVPGGAGIKIFYKYEKLPQFCYDCGRIGHDRNACKFVSREDGLYSGYSPDLRTGVARNLEPSTEPSHRPFPVSVPRALSPFQPRPVLREQSVARVGHASEIPQGKHALLGSEVSVRLSSGVLHGCMPTRVSVPAGDGAHGTTSTCDISARPAPQTKLTRPGKSGPGMHKGLNQVIGPPVHWAPHQLPIQLSAPSDLVLPNPPVSGAPQYIVTEPPDSHPSPKAHSAESLAHTQESMGLEEIAFPVSPSLEDPLNFRVRSTPPVGCAVNLVRDVILPQTKAWNMAKLESLLSSTEVAAIAALSISFENKEDAFIWHHEAKGTYTVSSGYAALVNTETTPSPLVPSSSFCWSDKEWKFIWGLAFPPKLKHFAWRLCNNYLATRQNLCNRSFDNTHARQEIVYKLLWLCWHIWKARNAHIFTHAPVDPRDVIVKAVRDDLEFLSAQALLVAQASNLRPAAGAARAWVPSSPGSLRVNCDVVIQPGATVGMAAALLRNDQGTLVDGVTTKVTISSVFQGEAMALRLACVMCDKLQLNRVEIEVGLVGKFCANKIVLGS
ncbi:hypothetical protein LOK49_LG09G01931 [Camellia lanceoleosa]|uniref:Uncharacterized protein n=1 Tax=Camellia lanceoleosa TaxID=1840588 RepID=A0ACC0GIL5_9ERIC|nr:hypothetical protein LOK49_LG09G01931 [Camellia lanceoleosa]